jgi:hypothetical protein
MTVKNQEEILQKMATVTATDVYRKGTFNEIEVSKKRSDLSPRRHKIAGSTLSESVNASIVGLREANYRQE